VTTSDQPKPTLPKRSKKPREDKIRVQPLLAGIYIMLTGLNEDKVNGSSMPTNTSTAQLPPHTMQGLFSLIFFGKE